MIFQQCESPFGEPRISLDVPKTVGEYELGSDLYVSFVTEPGVSFVALSGHLSVREVTDVQVQAGLYAYFDENFNVDGVFQVPICP